MNCANCGQPLDPGAAFCGNCGQPIQQEAAASQAPAPPQPPQAPAPIQPQVVQAQPQPPVVQPSHIEQVMENQAVTPATAPINYNNPAMGAVGGGVGSTPAYALAKPQSDSAEIKAIIALVLGVLAIPAGIFIPIAGLVPGIVGLVLATTARGKYRHKISLLAIIFSAVAVLVSLGVWGWRIESITQQQNNAATSIKLKTISTPCYNVQIDSGLNNYKPNGCNFDAADQVEEFTVSALDQPSVNSSNLDQYAEAALKQSAQSNGFTYDGGVAGTFMNDPAYVATISAGNSGTVLIKAVYHQSANGNNLYLISRTMRNQNNFTLGPLESTWQWK